MRKGRLETTAPLIAEETEIARARTARKRMPKSDHFLPFTTAARDRALSANLGGTGASDSFSETRDEAAPPLKLPGKL
jgi:hypothetical protein